MTPRGELSDACLRLVHDADAAVAQRPPHCRPPAPNWRAANVLRVHAIRSDACQRVNRIIRQLAAEEGEQ